MHIQFRVILALVLLALSGCSSTSLDQNRSGVRIPMSIESWAEGKDPLSVEYRLSEMYHADPSDEMEWWTLYNEAKIWAEQDPIKSCRDYKTLTTKTAFPLTHLATIRSLEICGNDEPGLPTLEQVLAQTTEPWLQETLKQTVLARAVRTGDKAMEMRMSFEVTDYRPLQSDKVKLLQHAIELAKNLNRTDVIPTYEAKLVKVAPRFTPSPKPTELIRVAADFRQARQFDRSRQIYEQAIASPAVADTEKLRAIDGIRQAYKNERKVDEYLAANQRMVDFARTRFLRAPTDRTWIDRFHDAGVLLARALWTEKTVSEAERALNKLEQDLGRHKEHDEINWIRARIEEEAGRFENAVKILSSAITPGNPNRELTEKILWYKAWNLRKIKRYQESITALTELNRTYGTATSRSRNLFWIGRSHLDLKHEAEAKMQFEQIILTDPLSYYAMISYRELDRALPAAKPQDPNSVDRRRWPGASLSPFESRADHDYMEWLLSVSEARIGQQFIEFYAAKHPQKNGPNTTAGRELLKYFARAGNYKALFAKIGGFPSDTRDRLIAEEPSLLFPEPYNTELSAPTKKFGVESELAYSIMRQESSFDPLARSPADAFGLMQLIPEAAKKVEDQTGMPITNPEQLYKPAVNVTVGTAFLRHLMGQFDDQFIPTVASYNASEKAINGWIATRYRGDTQEFIEDIPYEETKTYVKLVMRNYVTYKRLNSGGREVVFPPWCLDTLHPPK